MEHLGKQGPRSAWLLAHRFAKINNLDVLKNTKSPTGNRWALRYSLRAISYMLLAFAALCERGHAKLLSRSVNATQSSTERESTPLPGSRATNSVRS